LFGFQPREQNEEFVRHGLLDQIVTKGAEYFAQLFLNLWVERWCGVAGDSGLEPA
jgi:hypothetical protein